MQVLINKVLNEFLERPKTLTVLIKIKFKIILIFSCTGILLYKFLISKDDIYKELVLLNWFS